MTWHVYRSDTERLVEAGIELSVGSVGDCYENALAETINGLYKAEVIYRKSWKSREAVAENPRRFTERSCVTCPSRLHA
jgi:transposase InsO family protein